MNLAPVARGGGTPSWRSLLERNALLGCSEGKIFTGLLNFFLPCFLSFFLSLSLSLPDIAILRLLDCLDVARIVLAILPGHQNLGAEDRPLCQSLAGRHGGVLLLANCHEDVIDVRVPLSFSLLLSNTPVQSYQSYRPLLGRGRRRIGWSD